MPRSYYPAAKRVIRGYRKLGKRIYNKANNVRRIYRAIKSVPVRPMETGMRSRDSMGKYLMKKFTPSYKKASAMNSVFKRFRR